MPLHSYSSSGHLVRPLSDSTISAAYQHPIYAKPRPIQVLPNKRLLLPGRQRLRRRGLSFNLVCGGCGTPRSRSAGR